MDYGKLVLELTGLSDKQLRDEIIQQVYRMSRKYIENSEGVNEDSDIFAGHLSNYLATIEKANLRQSIYIEALYVTKIYKDDLAAWRSLYEKTATILENLHGKQKADRLLSELR